MQNIFVKKNQTKYEDNLIKEVDGLKVLSKAFEFQKKLLIPNVFHVDNNILHTEKIHSSTPTKEHFSILGKTLAQMHKKVCEFYGYDKDNYIGLNPQKNIFSSNWGDFFTKYRLSYQISIIKDRSIKENFHTALNSNCKKVENFLNDTTKHSSILHGDLWSGNIMFDTKNVYLIDPAVYYGDREVDIAMSEMFGSFDEEFYISYDNEYPLSKHYNKKRTIYNLYHNLNHYNLFGNSYLGGCESGFKLIESL